MRKIPIIVALLCASPLLACGKGAPAEPAAAPAAAVAAADTSAAPARLESSPPKAYAAAPTASVGTLPEGVGLPVGTRVPDGVSFTGLDGAPVTLASLVADGPRLLVFYRGGW